MVVVFQLATRLIPSKNDPFPFILSSFKSVKVKVQGF